MLGSFLAPALFSFSPTAIKHNFGDNHEQPSVVAERIIGQNDRKPSSNLFDLHGSRIEEDSTKSNPSDTAAPDPKISDLETKDKALATQIRRANYNLILNIPSEVVLQGPTEEQQQRIDLKLNTILTTLHPKNTAIKGAGIELKLSADINSIINSTPTIGKTQFIDPEDKTTQTRQVIKAKHLELALNQIINVISTQLKPDISKLEQQGSLTQEQIGSWNEALKLNYIPRPNTSNK